MQVSRLLSFERSPVVTSFSLTCLLLHSFLLIFLFLFSLLLLLFDSLSLSFFFICTATSFSAVVGTLYPVKLVNFLAANGGCRRVEIVPLPSRFISCSRCCSRCITTDIETAFLPFLLSFLLLLSPFSLCFQTSIHFNSMRIFKKRGETLNNELSYRFLSTLLIFKKCVRIENRQGLKQIEERNCIVHFHSNFFRSYRNRRQQYPLNFFYSSHSRRGNFNSQRQINFPPLSLDNPPVIFLP